MNIHTYLAQLELALASVQAEQRNAILNTVRVECEQKIAGGMSESEVIAGLPAPQILAKQKILALSYDRLKADFSPRGLLRWVLALGGLALANFLLFIPAMAWLSLLFAGFLSALLMYGSGVMLTASAVAGSQQFKLDIPARMLELNDHHSERSEVHHGQIIAGGSEVAVVTASSVPAQNVTANRTGEAVTKLEFTFRQSVLPRIASGLLLLILSVLTALGMLKLSVKSWHGLHHYLRWNRKVLQGV